MPLARLAGSSAPASGAARPAREAARSTREELADAALDRAAAAGALPHTRPITLDGAVPAAAADHAELRLAALVAAAAWAAKLAIGGVLARLIARPPAADREAALGLTELAATPAGARLAARASVLAALRAPAALAPLLTELAALAGLRAAAARARIHRAAAGSAHAGARRHRRDGGITAEPGAGRLRARRRRITAEARARRPARRRPARSRPTRRRPARR